MLNETIMKKPRLLTKVRSEHSGQVKGSQLLKGPRVHKFSHEDEFGWGFHEVEDVGQKKHVIDMKWINEYHDDIKKLQDVIKRERSLSFNTSTTNLLAKKDHSKSLSIESSTHQLLKDRTRSFCVHSRNLLESQSSKSEVSEIEESLRSTHSFEIEIPESFLDSSLPLKDQTISDSLLEVCEEETLENIDEEARSSTPFTEAFCSMQSFASRDSGISASDDLDIPNTPPEIHTDRSLLEELEGACDFEQSGSSTGQTVSNDLETSVQSDQFLDTLKASDKLTNALIANVNSKHKRPVWYKKFSIGNINVNLNSLACDRVPGSVVPELNNCSKEDSYNSLSIAIEKETVHNVPLHKSDCEDSRRRQRLRQLWSACDKLEALSLSQGSTVRGLSEVTELVDTLSKISDRLEVLKYDLHDLSLQVSESHKEMNNLEQRASDILESTETSRHHMSQLSCLERLQERLQEEWWAIHYPDLVTLEENYIV